MTKQVEFNAESFKKFRARYNEAIEKKEIQFTFEGNEYLTSYAKYVIEYLEPKFKTGGKK